MWNFEDKKQRECDEEKGGEEQHEEEGFVVQEVDGVRARTYRRTERYLDKAWDRGVIWSLINGSFFICYCCA